ncbi:MAG: hypothetical protein LN588_02660 [Rickettsia endosymbiont of Bryobia graminum]|nr:hypothetical protein [Rickettsia endosymbiont of Bryobia graminum]
MGSELEIEYKNASYICEDSHVTLLKYFFEFGGQATSLPKYYKDLYDNHHDDFSQNIDTTINGSASDGNYEEFLELSSKLKGVNENFKEEELENLIKGTNDCFIKCLQSNPQNHLVYDQYKATYDTVSLDTMKSFMLANVLDSMEREHLDREPLLVNITGDIF